MNTVTLYYNFVTIADPERFCLEHKRFCQSLDLFGRVYIASEGINGTLGGSTENIQKYQNFLRTLPGFEKTQFKDDQCDHVPFVKLIVKTRPEIVSLKASMDLDPEKNPQSHLSPKEWREVLESDEDITLIDVRNDYETEIGHFEGAICPPVRNFFDFEKWMDEQKLEKDKKVLMYCTGGIRCEKFSILMKEKGFEDVNQLDGGIINYAQKEGDAHYKGKCFVFDDRLSIPIEKDQKEPIGRCAITGEPSDTYINCANLDCNKLFICSKEGAKKYEGCCSKECMSSTNRRPFDLEKFNEPTRKWYNYFEAPPRQNK